jgi:putative CocE/NonD family hydrolase
VTRNVGIPMRDGTLLYADVYRPALANGRPAAGRFPAVLVQTPYGKSRATALLSPAARPLFIRHGYVEVVVDVRGTGDSEGVWDVLGEKEQRDYYDTARWVVAQPFSDGSFATYGGSYLGIDQLLTAAQRPPGLKAVFAMVAADDMYRDWIGHGGAMTSQFPLWLGQQSAPNLAPSPPVVVSDPLAAVSIGVARATQRAAARALASATIGDDLVYDGPFYRARSPGEVVARVTAPTFVVGGWHDLFQRGAPRLYDELRLAPGSKQLLVGPWYHTNVGEGLGVAGAPPELDDLALAWYDHWLMGADNGIERLGPVTVQPLGIERWQTYDQFPPAGVSYERWYLRGEHRLGLTRPRSSVAHSLPANPVSGACSRSTFQWVFAAPAPAGLCDSDQRVQEVATFTYTSSPLTQPLHLAGPLALHLRASTTGRDATWAATVSDVSPAGQSNPLTTGWLVQSMRAVDRARSTFTPRGDFVVPFHPFTRAGRRSVGRGSTEDLDIEIFNTDAVLRAGNRLRLTVTAADVPHLLPAAPAAAGGIGAIVTVRTSAAHPSYLVAPAAPAVS